MSPGNLRLNRPCFCCRRAQLGGFTLVELMIVILVASVLTALLVAAAGGVLSKARDAVVKAEIDQLQAATERYNTTYGSYPPNFIDADAVKRHVLGIFPRCLDSSPILTGVAGTTPIVPFNENVFTQQVAPNTHRDATGWNGPRCAEQLVFWLSGFYADPQHPLSPPLRQGASTTGAGVADDFVQDYPRVAMYNFANARLKPTGALYRPHVGAGFTGRTLPLYVYYPDGRDAPFVYFNSRNDYADLVSPVPAVLPAASKAPPGLPRLCYQGGNAGTDRKDKDNSRGGIRPYRTLRFPSLPYNATTNPAVYVNPESFQIISAGEDNTWSDGGDLPTDWGQLIWWHQVGMAVEAPPNTPATGKTTTLQPVGSTQSPFNKMGTEPQLRGIEAHKDNLTNFARLRMVDENK